jgi:hypothetical protein
MKPILPVLVLSLAIAVAATAAAAVVIVENPCNGAVDSNCTCKDGQYGCDAGEGCRLFVNNYCYVG